MKVTFARLGDLNMILRKKEEFSFCLVTREMMLLLRQLTGHADEVDV